MPAFFFANVFIFIVLHYRIAGLFRGRNFSRMAGISVFQIFADCLYVSHTPLTSARGRGARMPRIIFSRIGTAAKFANFFSREINPLRPLYGILMNVDTNGTP